jgi:uncharacterized protein YecT (DUF1311 family)
MALLFALGAGLVHPGAGRAALAPPVIHEPFAASVLPCPLHPRSTIEIEGCLERTLLRSDRRINVRVKAIFGLLPTSVGRTTFVDGERSWLRYRRSACRAQASFYIGGTAQPVEFGRCEVGRNKTHLADLAQLEHVMRQH